VKAQMDQYPGLGTPDDKKKQREVPDRLKELMEPFEQALELYEYPYDMEPEEKLFPHVLPPEDIARFMESVRQYEEHQRYSLTVGQVVTALIKNSYKSGNNRFYLRTEGKPDIHNIGAHLQRDERPLEIIVDGDVGEMFGYGSWGVNFIVRGNAGKDTGTRARASEFEIYGDVGSSCGYNADGNTFILHGEWGDSIGTISCGGSGISTYIVYTKEKFDALFSRSGLGKVILAEKGTNRELDKKRVRCD